MFVTLFVSDKGRKFFHYFRQLMIEGKQSDGSVIPQNLQYAFALLNYAIESCLTGSRYAYEMDTNVIIQQIFDSIPDSYHGRLPYLVSVNHASNPIKYYMSIVNYLGNKSLQIQFIPNITNKINWKKRVRHEVSNLSHLPHIIILEIFDERENRAGNSGKISDKSSEFTIYKTKYKLDSCVIRDIQQQHFCAMITCEEKEMAYDGMSFHRIVPMKWKDNINSQVKWTFEGSNNTDGSILEWSFMHGYQMLIYYRV